MAGLSRDAPSHEPAKLAYRMQFNDTTLASPALIQDCENWTNLGNAGISGDTTLLKQFTSGLNLAFDEVLPIVLSSDAKWQWDDPNHTNDPRATTDLESGVSSYAFITDEQGNSVLELQGVFIKAPDGNWKKLQAVDTGTSDTDAIQEANATNAGTPYRYDKHGVSIVLDPIPNYSSAGGLRAIFSRAQSYFAHDDTSKTPGIPSPFHRLLSLIASRDWVAVHKSENTALLAVIEKQIDNRKRELGVHMSKRARDERMVMRVRKESSR